MIHEALATAIDDLEINPDCESVAYVLSLRDRLDAKIGPALAALERSGEWELDGATSMVDWVKNAGRMSGGQAKAWVVQSLKLSQLPVTQRAWEDGELSSTQVRIITSTIKQRRVPLFAEHEADLVPFLAPLSAADTTHAMVEWRKHAEAIDQDREPAEYNRELSLSETLDGRHVLSGHFEEIGGKTIDKALQLATTDDADTEIRSPKQRRADALVAICRYFLDNQTVNTAKRHRPHLDVVVDAEGDGPGRFIDGTVAPRELVESMFCDCNLHRTLARGTSAILDYGRSARTAPPDLFNAIALRDGHCREPGCDRPPSWSDAHHVQMWEDDGETKLSNMVLRCTRHHVSWHKRRKLGWTERLEADGTLVLTDPSGRTYTSIPAGPLVQRQMFAV